jgi:serine/threonine protein kinase/Flp pilus assembly protein TadD
MNQSASADLADDNAELALVLEACLADLEAGRSLDLDRLRADHPRIAERLQDCLRALNVVRRTAPALGASPTQRDEAGFLGRLGDFDILREVGRGGMGVVYEAKQVSLGRRVALKVLPFAATLDPRQLQRFWTEAQAAAALHHAHIVPVYSVGCERGVHYYAMQFIEGKTLAELIADLRSQNAEGHRPAAGPAGNPTVVALTTERSTHAPGYFRCVARLALEAALALEHAHQLGVVHRDIKPGNLLLDAAGSLWITDFGLARLHSHPGLTLTGDTVGTLRYMSPEQALAKRALVDHRSDIYSLGLTIYELVTLQPAYPGQDREELLRQIALGEPRPPRRVNPHVPVDLETIIQKAMAREPEARYATAQELADDFQRFLDHRPVTAQRPTVRQRLQKWAWRHPAFLAAAAVVALLGIVALSVTTLLVWNERQKTKSALAQSRQNEEQAKAQRERADANFRKAMEGMDRLLWELENRRWENQPGFPDLRRELTQQSLRFFEEFVDEGDLDPNLRFQAARAYERMTMVHLVQKELDRALETHHKAVKLLEGLAAEHPEDVRYEFTRARAQWTMGNWTYSYKRYAQAREEFRQALAAYRRACRHDRDGKAHNNLATLLCDCQLVELRDPAEAVSAVRQALALAPGQREFWNTLGLAQYRAGDYRAAREALRKSMELSAGGDAYDWLILALIAWKDGERTEARKWYDQSARWMQTHSPSDDLYHLRKEAADLMDIRWP